MVRKHATERVVESGKITDIFLTPFKLVQLKKGQNAWIRVRSNWIVIHRIKQKKTALMIKIEKLEAKLSALKAAQPVIKKKIKKSKKNDWLTRTPQNAMPMQLKCVQPNLLKKPLPKT